MREDRGRRALPHQVDRLLPESPTSKIPADESHAGIRKLATALLERHTKSEHASLCLKNPIVRVRLRSTLADEAEAGVRFADEQFGDHAASRDVVDRHRAESRPLELDEHGCQVSIVESAR